MSSYKRISRSRKRELEEPDEFITVSSQIVKYLSEHSKQIIYGAVAVVVLVLGFSGLKYYSMQTEKAAQTLLDQTLEKYDAAQKDTTHSKLYQDLKPDFESFLEKYSGKNASKIARLIYADICFNAQDFETAANLYNRSLKDYKGQPFYSNLVRKNLAYAYESQKKYEDAISQLETVIESEDVKMKDEILFNMGRLYGLMDQKDKEKESLKKIMAEFPNSNYSEIAKESLAQ